MRSRPGGARGNAVEEAATTAGAGARRRRGDVRRSLMGDPPAKLTPQKDTDKILRAVGWMRAPLPELALVLRPLRALLDELIAGTRRTKRVASNNAIRE